ncbi:SEC14-like protein 2 [Lytechinus variegatus]|uniref:SEC14-like protein 2 n=1 Tax=Lytechinus variegatus TaxID=7654 RepID=UPI001BB1B8D7|nr:SEC14-like protein 2 [Lytechinus variegatus]XP_041456908.1 SEC14-like protein 2 [Lytechinus variegatus]
MEGESENPTLSPKQHDQLTKFREKVSDVLQPYHNDYWLLRFLKARNFNLKKSESMFRKNVIWREENKVSQVCDGYIEPEVLQKYKSGGKLGYAKDGRPVFLDPTGNLDFKGLLHSVTVSDATKLYIKTLESLQRDVISQTEKLKRQIDGIYYIVDLENLGRHHLWKPGVQFFTDVTQLCEQQYPELLHKVVVVRAPRIFPLAYSIVKPFLSEQTRKKIVVYKDDFENALLDIIDGDILPKYWGGNMVEDGDPMCPKTVCLAGKVPKEWYMTGRDLSVEASQMTTKEIARGGTLQLTYNTSQCNSVLRYEFRTQEHDLGFGVKRLHDDDTKTPVVKTERHNCHLVPETGQLILEDPGTYIVKFDNSFSWARSKKLFYWIELLEPDIQNDDQHDDDGNDDQEDDFVQAIDG